MLELCLYCGSAPHDGLCPRVAALEMNKDGSVRRVEFFKEFGPPVIVINPHELEEDDYATSH